MVDAKALTALGTKPRCEMQPRVSTRSEGRVVTNPGAGSGEKTGFRPWATVAGARGMQGWCLEKPASTTAEHYCMPDMSHVTTSHNPLNNSTRERFLSFAEVTGSNLPKVT